MPEPKTKEKIKWWPLERLNTVILLVIAVLTFLFTVPGMLCSKKEKEAGDNFTITNSNIDQSDRSVTQNFVFNQVGDTTGFAYFINYLKTVPVVSFCANGDFESGFEPSLWEYQRGIAVSTSHAEAGKLEDDTVSARYSLMSGEKDPFTEMLMTGKSGGKKSFRLGDPNSGAQANLLSKTILVDETSKVLYFPTCPLSKALNIAPMKTRLSWYGSTIS